MLRKMRRKISSSLQLLIVSSLLLLVFTWGYLSQSMQIRELAARQTALAEVVYDSRIATSRAKADRLVGVWGKLNQSALPPVPDAKCSDNICSNFAPGFHCAKTAVATLATRKSVVPKCRFQNGTSRPVYLLRSYPGSGNTWIRQVLEKVTGICTGSIYCDRELWLSGMIGEGVDTSSVLVVKTHAIETRGNATIFILRNPINAIVSFWKWYLIFRNIYTEKEGTHVLNPPLRYFRNNSGWNRCVKGQMRIWLSLIQHQLSRAEDPLLIVSYEDIKSNIRREVFRMLDFLHVSYSPEEVVERLKDEITAFKRPKSDQDFNPYTPPQRDLVRTSLRDFLESLHRDTTVKPFIERYLAES